MQPKDPRVKKGSVVQIDPSVEGFFPACFMTVTEVKEWGCQGYFQPFRTKDEPNPGQAYYRAKWQDIEYVGEAVWAVGE